jgi:DNA repair photolyase
MTGIMGIRLVKEERRSAILKQPAFGCLRDVPSINITRGCMHSCVYCYARGFTDAPPKGEVYLYRNLAERLERELERKRRIPLWVSFSTASDAFQDMDEVLKVTYACMRVLLERGIGISFLTKGRIPDDFIGLFRRFPDRVKARIGIVSLNEEYKRLFEPYSATPFLRLRNIRRLVEAGVDVSVRVDPVIPGVTDSDGSFEHLVKGLRASGVREISISAIIMRPSIMRLFDELPRSIAWRIIKLYQGQPYQRVITSARTRLLPKALRMDIYGRFKAIARRYGLDTRVCGCKNPDLPWEFCSPWVDGGGLIERQALLF